MHPPLSDITVPPGLMNRDELNVPRERRSWPQAPAGFSDLAQSPFRTVAVAMQLHLLHLKHVQMQLRDRLPGVMRRPKPDHTRGPRRPWVLDR
jgi:hypothetical protein